MRLKESATKFLKNANATSKKVANTTWNTTKNVGKATWSTAGKIAKATLPRPTTEPLVADIVNITMATGGSTAKIGAVAAASCIAGAGVTIMSVTNPGVAAITGIIAPIALTNYTLKSENMIHSIVKMFIMGCLMGISTAFPTIGMGIIAIGSTVFAFSIATEFIRIDYNHKLVENITKKQSVVPTFTPA